jgi:hypothetical protein
MTGLGAVSKAHGGDVRRIVHLRALLVGHGFCRGVTILDYSTSGLRLADTFALAVGERVTVELLTGHRLPVVVAWAVGSQMEVRLLVRLCRGTLLYCRLMLRRSDTGSVIRPSNTLEICARK